MSQIFRVNLNLCDLLKYGGIFKLYLSRTRRTENIFAMELNFVTLCSHVGGEHAGKERTTKRMKTVAETEKEWKKDETASKRDSLL